MTLKLKANINLNERCGRLNKFEFLQEEQNLELTLDLLSKEILNYIQKRKDVATGALQSTIAASKLPSGVNPYLPTYICSAYPLSSKLTFPK